jgi:5-methyltetrahydrofolate--homocysteine methyltransferase
MADLAALKAAVEAGDRAGAERLVTGAIAEGVAPQPILDVMTAAMDVVGQRFSRGEAYVPEMLLAARAMKQAMAVLEPKLVDAGIRPEFTAILGTVQGDLHDIGKNLVGMLWRGANFNVIDLGINVAPQAFADAAVEHDAQIIGVSALLTTTMTVMADVVTAVRASSRPRTPVILGGAPVTEEFARSIGADGYAPDAAAAVQVARSVVEALAAGSSR